jgi:hypothetical protein
LIIPPLNTTHRERLFSLAVISNSAGQINDSNHCRQLPHQSFVNALLGDTESELLGESGFPARSGAWAVGTQT